MRGDEISYFLRSASLEISFYSFNPNITFYAQTTKVKSFDNLYEHTGLDGYMGVFN